MILRYFLSLLSLLTMNVSVQAQSTAQRPASLPPAAQQISKQLSPQQKVSLETPADTTHQPRVLKERLTGAERRAPLIYSVVKVYQALKMGPSNAEGIWDAGVLRSDPELKLALDEYLQGKRGLLAKSLDLSGKTAAEIHSLLLAKGFKHEAVQNPLKSKTVQQSDADSQSLQQPPSFKMDIYVHEDGSLIRLKPEGIPRTARVPFHFPHYTKSVLRSLKPMCEGKVCHLDTSFQNEAFKVTEEGDPVPKGPRADFGMRFLYPESQKKNRMYQVDTLMRLAHPTLAEPAKPVTLH